MRYAKHAISIDEDRADFKRVEWGRFDPERPPRDELDNPWFEQVWFPGCHSDVGGSYPENEARFSDGALRWMLAAASITPEPVLYDDSVLQTFPSSTGMQHDERLAGLGILTRLLHITYSKRSRILPVPKGKRWSEAAMHKSVYQRFDAGLVQQYDRKKHYRPDTVRNHVDFHVAFEAGIDQTRPDKTTEARAVDSEWRADKKLGQCA